MKKHRKSIQEQGKWYSRWLAGFAIITIPILSLLFAAKESPFDYTLSQIGNYFDWDHRKDFIIWGIVTGGCFVFYIRYLFKKVHFQNKRANLWLVLSNVFLVLTVITPSIKDVFPIFTRLHMLFSIAFAVSLVLSTAFFIQYLGEVDEEISARSLKWMLIIVGGSILSLFIFGKTGIFELFFLISFSIFLLSLGIWLRKDELLQKIKDMIEQHF